MIFTLIFVGILMLSFNIYRFSKILYNKYGIWNDMADSASCILFVIGIVGLLTCILLNLCANVGVDNQITKNQIKYEILCEKYKLIQSDYEDVSKVKVLEEIEKWNTEVQDEKYWSENLWTNWFHNKQVVDSLQYIDISKIN